MIDHVSIPVRNLKDSANFYEALFKTIDYLRIIDKPGTVGFGKQYADIWLNERPDMQPIGSDSGFHVCLRTKSRKHVEHFYQKALELGATAEGSPGFRAEYSNNYFAAFVIDHDGNKIEVVTFTDACS
ncbi:MAG: VOC family protein [Pseudomonadales bacterium]|nr:VOC family protein [Pseudomonadales bacterium]